MSEVALPARRKRGLGTRLANAASTSTGRMIVWVLAAIWTIPTLGLLVSSLRPEHEIKTSGWWSAAVRPTFTIQNYAAVFGSGTDVRIGTPFLNSLKIVIPSVAISVTLAAMASYALSWMAFRGRDWLFVGIVALLVVPLQMAVIPLLRLLNTGAHIGSTAIFPPLPFANTALPVWIAHSVFGMPFCVYILRNFIAALPTELIEAARLDGAGHMRVFRLIVLPLSAPSIASLTIFQFIYIWNDFFVGKVFGGEENRPITVALVSLSGSRGQAWHLLTAAAVVSTIVPLAVFFSMQRYFVKGLLAGSVKG
jgi:alpha-glucoside transport system permease protein